MKRKLIALTTMIFTFLALTGICQAQLGFKLKLTGGYGTMKTGDYNTYSEKLDTFWKDYLSLIELASGIEGTKEGEFKKINMGVEYDVELIMNLAGPFGIGVGAGYIKRGKESVISTSHPLGGNVSTSIKPDFTVIPVCLSVYISPPAVAPMNFYLYGGVGYYFGKSTSTFKVELQEVGFPSSWQETEVDLKDRGFGFHGGVGLEFSVVPKIAFFIEGKGRYCKLKSWEGKFTVEDSGGFKYEEEEGTMWYYETTIDTDLLYPMVELSEYKPSWDGIKNVREFEVDLSGISIRAGIRIKF